MQKKKFNTATSIIFPLITALLWGTGFIAQKYNTAGAFLFNSVRSLLTVPVLMLVVFFMQHFSFKNVLWEEKPEETKRLWRGGILCGTALTVAMWCQQKGLDLGIDAGKGAFITALYMVFVPIFGLFVKRKATQHTIFSIVIAMVGLYFLCLHDKSYSGFALCDLLCLLSAMFYAIQILFIDRFAPTCHCVKLSAIQFLTVGVLSTVLSLVFGEVNFTDFSVTASQISDSFLPALYLAVVSNGCAYTLQMVAQKTGEAALVSLMVSLESVFALIFGVLIFRETMTGWESMGSAIMFLSVVMAVLLPYMRRIQTWFHKRRGKKSCE